MNEFRIGDHVRYQPAPGERMPPHWTARAFDYDSVIETLPWPASGSYAYGMAAVGPRSDRWFAAPSRLRRVDGRAAHSDRDKSEPPIIHRAPGAAFAPLADWERELLRAAAQGAGGAEVASRDEANRFSGDVTPQPDAWECDHHPEWADDQNRCHHPSHAGDVTPQPDTEREAPRQHHERLTWPLRRHVADAEQAANLARIRELEDEVERQAVLLRAINDCHRDPARAILQADKIAGAAILRAEKAEAALARVEEAVHDHPNCIGECACAVYAVDAAMAGTDTPAAPEASHTCPLCGLAGGHAVRETPKWADLFGIDPTFELMPDPEVAELRAEQTANAARIRELEDELLWATNHNGDLQERVEKAEAKAARVEALHVLSRHPIRGWVNCSTCGAHMGTCPTRAALAGTETPTTPGDDLWTDHPRFE